VSRSAVSVASSAARIRQTAKRQMAKKPRAEGTGLGGGSGGDEEQVFNYVVERFDDDVFAPVTTSVGIL